MGPSWELFWALWGSLGALWAISWGFLGVLLVSLGSLFASLGLSVHFLQPQGLIFDGFRFQKARFSLQSVLKNDAPTIVGASFSEN